MDWILVDVQLPRDEAASKALVVIILYVEHALLSHKVLRKLMLSASPQRFQMLSECSQVVLRHIGDFKLLNTVENDSAWHVVHFLSVKLELLANNVQEIIPGVHAMHLQRVDGNWRKLETNFTSRAMRVRRRLHNAPDINSKR